jgi:hypothetical protein
VQAPTTNRITQTAHLASKAVDHSANPDPYVYAPEAGRIDSYQRRGSGTSDAGNVLRLAGKTGMHSFCHLSKSLVTVGQTVTQGQKIAVMGYTGYTIPSGAAGAHLHYYVLTPNGYVYPPTLYKSAPSAGGSEVADRTQVNNIYKAVLHREGDAGGLNNYTGRDANKIISEMMGSQEFKNHQNFLNTVTKQVQDLQTALANEKNKPPQVVEKQVEKIFEKIVKVEVPVEIIKTVEVEPSWLTKVRDFLNNFLKKG